MLSRRPNRTGWISTGARLTEEFFSTPWPACATRRANISGLRCLRDVDLAAEVERRVYTFHSPRDARQEYAKVADCCGTMRVGLEAIRDGKLSLLAPRMLWYRVGYGPSIRASSLGVLVLQQTYRGADHSEWEAAVVRAWEMFPQAGEPHAHSRRGVPTGLCSLPIRAQAPRHSYRDGPP